MNEQPYYTDEAILYIIENHVIIFDSTEIIGHLDIRTNDGIISSPMTDHNITPKETKGVHLNYEIIKNLQKGKWEIGKLSFNRENDVYVIRFCKYPKEEDKIIHRKIESVSGEGANVGFYQCLKKYPNLHYSPNDRISEVPHKVHGTYGITISDDIGLPFITTSAIISEYKEKIFRIILIKYTPNLEE